MAAVTASLVKRELAGIIQQRGVFKVKCLIVETASTVDATDTFKIDLATYGGSRLLTVDGCRHTTDNSVIVTENPTTAVSGTVITFAVPAGTDDKKRIAKIYFV